MSRNCFNFSRHIRAVSKYRAFMAQLMGCPLLKLITDLEMFCWGQSIIIIKVVLVGQLIDIHAVVVYLRFKLFGGNFNDDSVRSIGS